MRALHGVPGPTRGPVVEQVTMAAIYLAIVMLVLALVEVVPAEPLARTTSAPVPEPAPLQAAGLAEPLSVVELPSSQRLVTGRLTTDDSTAARWIVGALAVGPFGCLGVVEPGAPFAALVFPAGTTIVSDDDGVVGVAGSAGQPVTVGDTVMLRGRHHVVGADDLQQATGVDRNQIPDEILMCVREGVGVAVVGG